MEYLLGTRRCAKGWEYRDSWRRESHGWLDLMPHKTDINEVTGSLYEALGFPRRKLLMREGVDSGQGENSGNSIPG